MESIKNLEPKAVWGYFDQITRIARPSKREELICAYLRDFGHLHGLEVLEDSKGNIVIVKPATVGYEHLAAIVLQSHVDMVCEKDPAVEFDFSKDAIQTYIEDGWVRARGTTLGADCGIGMALSLAVLTAEGISHPRIEALFTVDEEQGLTGAKELGRGMLTGERMINLDSEDEGEIYIGCAGGVDTIASFEYHTKKAPTKGYEYRRIEVSGLCGGHSGDDINRGYANANKLLTRVLWSLMSQSDTLLCLLDGGNLRNAIARDAWAVVAIDETLLDLATADFERVYSDIRAEFDTREPNMVMSFEVTEPTRHRIDRATAHRLVAALQAAPHGVQAMSPTMPGMVETSTNLASVKMVEPEEIIVTTSQRSSLEGAKRDIATTVESVFRLAGAAVHHTDGYPGWSPNPTSEFVQNAARLYQEMFSREARVKTIHAGLECGLILEKYPQLDIISIGPTLRGVHSPAERIEIVTVKMLYDYLLALLALK